MKLEFIFLSNISNLINSLSMKPSPSKTNGSNFFKFKKYLPQRNHEYCKCH